ncbi:MAG: hypothetical protein JO316_17050 [Abitibacteriaceae bacterium]|nr:hypothetical protein [Abditibacteriaceae bacterium]MBV9867064.1 hypothetical protein [Abditibacteriaceae bacterium]
MSNSQHPGEDSNEPTPERAEQLKEAGELLKEWAEATKGEDSQAAAIARLKIWAQFGKMKEEPSPWLDAMREARRCEAAFDWAGAEASYQRAIASSPDSPGLQYGGYRELAYFYRLLGRDAEALQAKRQATDWARLDGLAIKIAMALEAEAAGYLLLKDLPTAWAKLEEAFNFIGDDLLLRLPRARGFILRADYFLAVDDITQAHNALNAAWPLVQPHADAFSSLGWQSSLAHGWSTMARLRAAQDDLVGAIAPYREAVHRWRIIAQAPHAQGPYKFNSLAGALRDLGCALRAVGDPLAKDAFQESHSIRRSIGLLPLEESPL